MELKSTLVRSEQIKHQAHPLCKLSCITFGCGESSIKNEDTLSLVCSYLKKLERDAGPDLGEAPDLGTRNRVALIKSLFQSNNKSNDREIRKNTARGQKNLTRDKEGLVLRKKKKKKYQFLMVVHKSRPATQIFQNS